MSNDPPSQPPFVPPTPQTPLPSSAFVTPAKLTLNARARQRAAEREALNALRDPTSVSNTTLDPVQELPEPETHTATSLDEHKDTPSTSENEQVDVDELRREFDVNTIQMQQQIAHLQQALERSQQETAYLNYQARQAYHQPQTQTLPTNFLSNVGKPEFFTGDLKSNPGSWIDQVRDYMMLTNVPPPVQVAFAASYLREQARTWWSHMPIEEKMRNQDFESFARTLLQRFRPVDSARIARAQLNDLRQTNSVSTYNTQFLTVMQLIHDMSVSDQLYYYTKGLKNWIQEKLVTSEFTSLSAAMVAATRVDTLMFHTRPHGAWSSSNRTANPVPLSSARRPTNSAPMAVNNVSASYAPMYQYSDEPSQPTDADSIATASLNAMRLGKLTPAEREECRKQGRCFKCRQRGHMALNCPNRSSQPSQSPIGGMRPSAPISQKNY